ncbi:DUF2933 domain-containing protein [Virgibacillus oceani]|uniref:DUF2933 domain-containing protein n=1 Tax=Virgibacillus oceani TaxID=1479511 RepID=A0A917LWA0_9BACI|nr:DUF2933 domain-containing protein [Virgibacillus oceani]GGG60876.1 hypothetical protein GCM10011398_00100 [Virgibacillus oceani]
MNWELLILLACPLMMLFCMKGMFGGNKNKDLKEDSNNNQLQSSQQDELQSVQLKMVDLMEQNHQLMEEVKALKASESKESNVVHFEENQGKQEAL